MFKKRRRQHNKEINPDEIFLDSSNLPEFNVYQLEGRMEKSIPKRTIIFLGIFFLLIQILFMGKLALLQVKDGESFKSLSENNRLRHAPLFAERGVIFDRNGEELVWNTIFKEREEDFSQRTYIKKQGFSHVLGYVGYPLRDSAGYYYDTNFEGKDGVELAYGDLLSGVNGIKIIETNALGEVQSENTTRLAIDGKNIFLTIDWRLQEKFSETIGNLVRDVGFDAGAGIIMDIETGELLALTSFPEYDSNILTRGKDRKSINDFINDTTNPFLNRAVSGLYTPGSIVKPFVALSALNEGVITPSKKILSTGSISLPNPYFPDKRSVFTDWKAHGWVDIRDALAISSNVYFYEVGGGFEDQPGVGIEKIEVYMKLFGLSKKTGVDLEGELEGVIPTPQWKKKVFDDEWRIGDTYNTSIGQYGFQITPIQAVRAIAGVASGGVLVLPHIVKSIEENNNDGDGVIQEYREKKSKIKYIQEEHYAVVREGMRQAVTAGTAGGLNIRAVKIAAKTGTAEVGVSKKFVNSWIIGFFPYENPRYAFAVVMEHGPRENLIGGLYVMRQVLDWMSLNTPEYLK